jgi:PAS domain S-box-containing protein
MQAFAKTSNLLGISSLVLYLFVVLVTIIRTGENIGELGERFAYLADHMSEGFLLRSDDGNVTMVNKQFLEMFQLRESEALGEHWPTLVGRLQLNAEGSALTIPEHMDYRSKGLQSEYEASCSVGGQERRFCFNGVPIFDSRGKHTATLVTVRDISEQFRMARRLERYAQGLQTLVEEQTQKLQTSEERFRHLLLSMNEGFLTVDADHRICFANERVCSLFGTPRESLAEEDIFDYLDAAGRLRLLSVFSQGEALLGVDSRQELNFIDADGQQIPAVVGVAFIQNSSEGEAAFSLVVTSVSDLKEMQKQLEARAGELERVNEELRMHDRAKDSFLTNVSHELRTPLSTVQGYVEMLQSGSLGDLDAPQEAAITAMRRNVSRLVGLINEMIAFSRMEIRGIQLVTRLFSPGKFIRDAVASVHPQALAKDISINTFAPDSLPLIWADRSKMNQVLGILLNNAVKFTDAKGIINIKAVVEPDHTVIFSVSDTGIGIDAAHREKVFSKFYQVDASMTRRYEGTGIGLPIAKSIVEAHNGHIALESEPQRGSTFRVFLPNATFDGKYDQALVKGFDNLDILIVNEVKVFSDLMNKILKPSGCSVTEGSNGYECVRIAERKNPDVILLNDWKSNVVGMNTVRLLRENPMTQSVPVVVFSSDTSSTTELDERWNNVFFIVRPFDAKTILTQIRLACFGHTVVHEQGQRTTPLEHSDDTRSVLLIDKDPELLQWMSTALRNRDTRCCSVENPDAALDLVKNFPPDVIFLDGDVLPAAADERVSIFRNCPDTQDVPLYIMTGQRSGYPPFKNVDGILTKPFEIDTIMALVQKPARNEVLAVEALAPKEISAQGG